VGFYFFEGGQEFGYRSIFFPSMLK
jgi:hypothetical protein